MAVESTALGLQRLREVVSALEDNRRIPAQVTVTQTILDNHTEDEVEV